MKIAFSRINSTAYPFKLNLENIVFEGNLSRINPKLVKMQAKMQGFVYRPCDRCGAEMELRIDENLELLVSDGFYKDPKNELSDTIEFFDSHCYGRVRSLFERLFLLRFLQRKRLIFKKEKKWQYLREELAKLVQLNAEHIIKLVFLCL